MKRINLFAIALLVCIAAIAQKKPKINRVERYLKDGKISEAKAIVDAGIEHPKTMDDEKTWFMRALTYVAIDTTASFTGEKDGARAKAVEAFNKAAELSGDKEPYIYEEGASLPTTMSQLKQQYFQYYYNKAAAAYENGNYSLAVENFEKVQEVNPTDTVAYIYAGYAAQNAKDFEAAKRNYMGAIENGAKEKDIYSLLIYLLDNKFDQKDKALEYVRKAKEVYPDDVELARMEVNLLIQMDKTEEAKNNLLNTIESDPDDPDLYFTLGVLYDELGNSDEALNAYKQALEVDPNHYNSNYNIGVLLVNEANAIIKEEANLGMSKADQKKSQELRPKIDKALKNALPQWEKLYGLDSTDVTTLETLQYIYGRLGDKEKAKKISEELKAINGE